MTAVYTKEKETLLEEDKKQQEGSDQQDQVFGISDTEPDNGALDYVCVLPVRYSNRLARLVDVRVNIVRMIYNDLLGEIERRKDRSIRGAKNKISSLEKEGKKLSKKEISKIYKENDKRFGYSEYSLNAYSKKFTQTWMNKDGHIGARNVSMIASRAFQSSEKCRYAERRKNGKRPQVKFRKKGDIKEFPSTTQVTNPGIVIHNNEIYLKWSKGRNPAGWQKNPEQYDCFKIDTPGDYEKRIKQAILKDKEIVRYVTITSETKGKKLLVYAQIHIKDKYLAKDISKKEGKIGIDIGPSSIAVVAEDGWSKRYDYRNEDLYKKFQQLEKDIYLLQRKTQRQREANNPNNYFINKKGRSEPKKTNKKPVWHNGENYKKNLSVLRQKERAYNQLKKNEMGKIINEILEHGSMPLVEKNPYKAWQMCGRFARSMKAFSPSMFADKLQWGVKKRDGLFIDVDTYSTRLSQTCLCGNVDKKELYEREHECKVCGLGKDTRIDRDLFSAYLMMFVDDDGKKLDLERARKEFKIELVELRKNNKKENV